MDFSDESMNNSTVCPEIEIKSKILRGEYKIGQKRVRSKIWNIFGNIETDNGSKVPGFLVCRECQNIYKYNKKTTSNLVKHKCYVDAEMKNAAAVPKISADIATKKQALYLFTKWVVVNCRPFKIAGDAGLKEIAEFFISIGFKFGVNVDLTTFIPDPLTISRNVESLYATRFEDIYNEIGTIREIGYGLTSDLWTDNYLQKSYLSLTMHYVKDGNIYCRLLGMKAMDNERNTSKNIHAKVAELLESFGCSLDNKTVIVTDCGFNMVSAFQPYNHLFCINKLLQTTLKKSIYEVDGISKMYKLGTKIVRYCKMSDKNSNFVKSLKSYSPRGWNTFYYVFVSIKRNFNEIIQIFKDKNELQMLLEFNIPLLKGLIEFLEFFEEALKELEGDKYPTLHIVIVHIDQLLRTCAIKNYDMTVIKHFKEKVLFYLKTLVLKNLNIYHKIALFLFPPANKLIQFEDEEKEDIRMATKEIMSQLSESHQYSSAIISSKKSDLFRPFVTKQNPTNSSDRVSEELAMYESLTIYYNDEFDVLKWWDINKNKFPLLYKTSCRILAIPASIASSERVFSAARSLLTEKRGQLSGNFENVNHTIFLHQNSF